MRRLYFLELFFRLHLQSESSTKTMWFQGLGRWYIAIVQRALSNDFVYINTGSVILIDNSIYLGNDIWIGRNCQINDSDFHSTLNEDGSVRNHPKPLIIGNHIWVTNNVMISKSVTIKEIMWSARTQLSRERFPLVLLFLMGLSNP